MDTNLITLLAWSKSKGISYSTAKTWQKAGCIATQRSESGKRILIREDHPLPDVPNMDGLVSLFTWCKQNNITYSVAQQWMRDGTIETIRNETGKRVLIREDYPIPQTEKIACMVCGQMFPQITGTHLKLHDLTLSEYKTKFPDSPIVSKEVREKNRDALLGIKRSEESKKKISQGRRGIRPKAHPRYQKGAWSPTKETRKKMGDARRGRTHTEETKQKIGDAHRGVPETPQAIENNRLAKLEYWKNNESPKLGTSLHEEHKDKISKGMRAFNESLSPEYREERRQRLISYAKGKKRTPEQRERYRKARLKYIEEHPDEWQRFSETKLELEFKAWCEELDIECWPQYFMHHEGQAHPFDFYLPEYKILVECDGPLHWELPWFATDDPQKFLESQQTQDQFWTQVAEQRGYTVIRLRGRNSVGDEGSGSIDEQLLGSLES